MGKVDRGFVLVWRFFGLPIAAVPLLPDPSLPPSSASQQPPRPNRSDATARTPAPASARRDVSVCTSRGPSASRPDLFARAQPCRPSPSLSSRLRPASVCRASTAAQAVCPASTDARPSVSLSRAPPSLCLSSRSRRLHRDTPEPASSTTHCGSSPSHPELRFPSHA